MFKPFSRSSLIPIACLVCLGCLGGCFAARGIVEIKTQPYPLIYQDDSTARFGDRDDSVFIEVRRAEITRRLDNLAIHYQAMFPGGEIIKPGDIEEYLDIDGRNAYKVLFRTKHIRKRKRVDKTLPADKVPEGWTSRIVSDPVAGTETSVLYGPIVPQLRTLYLVEGKVYLYYLFLRADGDAIPSAKRKFEEFVRKGIAYK